MINIQARALRDRGWLTLGPIVPAALAVLIATTIVLAGSAGAIAWFAVLGVVAIAWTVGRPRALIAIALLYSASFGAITAVPALEGIRLGGTTVSGAGVGTTVILLVAALTLLSRADRQRVSGFLPFAAFWLLAFIQGVGALYSPAPLEGAKQAVLIGVPLIIAAVTYDAVRAAPETQHAVQRYVLASATALLVFLAVLALTGALGVTDVGLGSSIGARSIAFFALPTLSLSLAMWRHGRDAREKLHGKWYSLVLLLVVVATLSRTATAVALGMLLPLRLIGAGWRRGIVALVVGILLFFGAFQFIAPFGRRFFLDRPGSLRDLVVADGLNTMGRSTMWAITWSAAQDRIVLGHGTGAARLLMQATVELEHPHNDYLKVLYDSGAIGVTALVIGLLMALARHGRDWKDAERRGQQESAKYHMAAFFAAISFAACLFTDNVLVYTFVTIPTFVLLALSVARETKLRHPSTV